MNCLRGSVIVIPYPWFACQVGDTVTLEDRGARNVRGTVKFIYNGTLWIQSKQVRTTRAYLTLAA